MKIKRLCMSTGSLQYVLRKTNLKRHQSFPRKGLLLDSWEIIHSTVETFLYVDFHTPFETPDLLLLS